MERKSREEKEQKLKLFLKKKGRTEVEDDCKREKKKGVREEQRTKQGNREFH